MWQESGSSTGLECTPDLVGDAELRAEGFKDFVVEINGDNLRFASEERGAEIEAFLSNKDELPIADRIVFFY